MSITQGCLTASATNSRGQEALPMVTVVIPLYNHAGCVRRCIESIVNQTYPRKQIIVVDDGSGDGSWMQVAIMLTKSNYEKPTLGVVVGSDVNLILTRHESSKGPAAARNTGIKLAWNYTDLFAFLDSDDLYEPTKLETSVAKWLEAPSEIGAVYSDYDTFNDQTGLVIRNYKEPYSYSRLCRECIVNCDSLVSKKALEVCGLFDETLRVCEDYDLWLRIAERFTLIHVPEPLVRIRVGTHSSTNTVAKQQWEACYRRVFEKRQQRLEQASANKS